MPIITCPACGGAIPDGARFCPTLRPAGLGLAGGEERKLATIVFADLADSSQLATRDGRRGAAGAAGRRLRPAVAGGGVVRRHRREVHRRRDHGRVRRAHGARGRPRAGRPRRARHAVAADRRSPAATASELVLRVGVNTGVVATGSRHRPRLPGHRRRRQRRRPPAAGGGAGRGAGRRPHLPRAPAAGADRAAAHGDRSRAARAASRRTRSSASRRPPCTGSAGRPGRSSAGRASCR